MNTQLKPLGKARTIVESVNLEVTYAYEDLVFVEHNPFLIRFDEKDGRQVYLHFNVDCDIDESMRLTRQLTEAAKAEGLILVPASSYRMVEKESTSELEIRFMS